MTQRLIRVGSASSLTHGTEGVFPEDISPRPHEGI